MQMTLQNKKGKQRTRLPPNVGSSAFPREVDKVCSPAVSNPGPT